MRCFVDVLFVLLSATQCLPSVHGILVPKAATSETTTNAPTPQGNAKLLVGDLMEDVEVFIGSASAFAGKIFPILSKLYISPAKAKHILEEVKTVANLGEWIMIVLIGWLIVPLVRYPYEKIGLTPRKLDDNAESNETVKQKPPFEESFSYHLASHVAGAGKIAALVYCIDCLLIVIQTMGFGIKQKYGSSLAKVIYSTWIISRLLEWKRYFVRTTIFALGKKHKGWKKRAKIANDASDILVLAVGAFSLLDILKIKTGLTLKSFFAVGGAGTIVLSFASKDLAIGLVSGWALQASDKVFEGDLIKFNGITGTVDRIGVMETIITDDYEMIMAIPNMELTKSRLINVSRIKCSRLKQDIRFNYDDSPKLPKILDDIKKEIHSTCSLVITDGSKPLRAFFVNYGEGCLEVEVDVRLSCRPGSEDFKRGREEVLLAIDRAVRKNNVKFAVLNDYAITEKSKSQLE